MPSKDWTENKTWLNVIVSREDKEKLREIAQREDTTMSKLAARAISQLVRRKERNG